MKEKKRQQKEQEPGKEPALFTKTENQILTPTKPGKRQREDGKLTGGGKDSSGGGPGKKQKGQSQFWHLA